MSEEFKPKVVELSDEEAGKASGGLDAKIKDKLIVRNAMYITLTRLTQTAKYRRTIVLLPQPPRLSHKKELTEQVAQGFKRRRFVLPICLSFK